jgi:hypothetical protein
LLLVSPSQPIGKGNQEERRPAVKPNFLNERFPHIPQAKLSHLTLPNYRGGWEI